MVIYKGEVEKFNLELKKNVSYSIKAIFNDLSTSKPFTLIEFVDDLKIMHFHEGYSIIKKEKLLTEVKKESVHSKIAFMPLRLYADAEITVYQEPSV